MISYTEKAHSTQWGFVAVVAAAVAVIPSWIGFGPMQSKQSRHPKMTQSVLVGVVDEEAMEMLGCYVSYYWEASPVTTTGGDLGRKHSQNEEISTTPG